jgi:(2Fe-2S) ferredoxin
MVDRPELWVCVNWRYGGPKPSCAGQGSEKIADAFERAFAERGLDVKLVRSPCQSACDRGPTVRLIPGPVLYLGTRLEDVPAVVDKVAAVLAARDAAG